MGYYSDEFFKEYEDVFSDSEDFDEKPQSRRESSRKINNDSPFDVDGNRGSYRNRGTENRSPENIYRDRDPRSVKAFDDNYRNPRRRNTNQRKRRMSRRLRRTLIVAAFALIIALLLSGIIAIAVSVSGVGEVSSVTPTEVTAHQIALSWEKVNRAEGYRVMMAKGGTEDYELIQTIEDPDTLTVTVPDLEQAASYSFSVTAFRGNKESKPVSAENIWTLPDTPEITNVFSAKAGSIHVDWTENEKANGYVVEYKKSGGEYSADAAVTVSDAAQCSADVTELEVNADYQVRVYAFVTQDKQLNSTPSAEETVKVVAQDTEVIPKAKAMKVDGTLDPDKPMIALTFDDGPAVGNDSGDRILDVLEQYNAKATFFMLGCNAGEAEDNLKRKVDLKMEIGNHTWNHTHLGSEVTTEDIRKGSNGIYEVCGQFPTCFRSPGGMTTNTILTECETEGMAAYYWSIDTQDWSSRDADAVYHAVMDYVKDGDIVLMHEIYGSTADAVEKMVPELIEKGFQLVTCHDLITLKGGSEPVPGKQYVDAFREMAPQ